MTPTARALAIVLLAIPAMVVAQETHRHAAAPERLGSVHFVTSCRPEVQATFDRGVALLHSFWFDAAVAAFEEVARQDPGCGVSQWGVALGLWGNILGAGPTNSGVDRAKAAIDQGRAMGTASARERAYLDAVHAFYDGAPAAAVRSRKLAYATAMERLMRAYPDDSEAAIFYAMGLTGTQAADDKTYAALLKASAILEPLFERMPDHPGLAHYIIHAFDVPPLAPRALAAARKYGAIAPDAPHALHMPSHTFTRLGLWTESIDANLASAASARRAKSPGDELHAYDYLVYAYLQTAQDAAAARILAAAEALATRAAEGGLGQGNLPAAPGGGVGAYALTAMPARLTLERGAWREAAALRERDGAPPAIRAMTLFARALGHARGGGDLTAARADLAQLERIHQELATAGQSYDAEQVEIQRLSVAAWIQMAEGRVDEALVLMRRGAEAQDRTEKSAVSPGPIAPARELHAEMLAAAGRHADALAAFVASAKQEPGRFRGLYGAATAARRGGDLAAARRYYEELLRIAEKGDPTRADLADARRQAASLGVTSPRAPRIER
jgi:tetratricopeptide (TPR) repeat protein